jgi:hypothetical protein
LIHVIAPPHSHPCRAPWVRAYRTSLLAEEEIVRRDDGIRLTSPPRTVVDLTRYVDPLSLASVIEHVLAQQMSTVATLARTAGRLVSPGRPWVRRLLAVLEQRHPGAAAESEWELHVCNALVQRGVPGLERQVWRELPGYGRARFDIAIPELQWALEIDIHPDHGLEGGAADKRRDRCARAIGWETERVGEGDSSPASKPPSAPSFRRSIVGARRSTRSAQPASGRCDVSGERPTAAHRAPHTTRGPTW